MIYMEGATMRVDQLPGVETEQVSRLRSAGIRNCRQLLRAGQRQERFHVLARSTQMPQETLYQLVQRAELTQIRGVGPRTLSRLFAVGVDSLATLAGQEPERLQARLQLLATKPPNLAVIEDWILQARQRHGGQEISPLGTVSPL